MALRGDQRSHLVHRQCDPLLAYVRTHIRYKLGGAYFGHLLCQHLPTWDEWSSPSELIHPGDRPRISSIKSNYTKLVYGATGVVFAATSAWLTETWRPILPRRTARIAKRSTAHRVAAKGRGRPHNINGVLRRACGSKWPGARRLAVSIVSQCFWAESVGVLASIFRAAWLGRAEPVLAGLWG
jgi:hypothetical protein